VRLSSRKIEYLAEKILKMCQENSKTHLVANQDLVYRAVADAIYSNMQREEAIDEEVEALLQKHRGEIHTLEMDMAALRQKFKRELARKHGFVL
jgi:hypothetical protein